MGAAHGEGLPNAPGVPVEVAGPPIVGPPDAVMGGDAPAAPEVADDDVVRYSVPGGEIRYYHKNGRFVAHCENPAHGNCRREKLGYAGVRKAQGRPLGYLMAWLAEAEDYDTHAQHLACTNNLPLGARQAGREALKAAIGSDAVLFRAERACREGELEEPELCP